MRELVGKNILIVEGSVVATHELQETLREAKARPIVARNVNAAFDLLQRLKIDGVIVDQALHNEAFEVCSECQERRVAYICCNAPHRLQGLSSRRDDAAHTVWRLAHIMARAKERAFGTPAAQPQRDDFDVRGKCAHRGSSADDALLPAIADTAASVEAEAARSADRRCR